MCRNTVSEPLLATVESTDEWPQPTSTTSNTMPSPANAMEQDDYLMTEPKQTLSINETSTEGNVFFFPRVRTALGTWYGVEDVIEVDFEMAKSACKVKIANPETSALHPSQWLRFVRFRMAVYVPGNTWQARRYIDLALPRHFKRPLRMRQYTRILFRASDTSTDNNLGFGL